MSQADLLVKVDVDGKTYSGTYRVERGVVRVWTTGLDGVHIGPFSMILRGMQAEAAARTLLRNYALSSPQPE